MSRTAFLSAWKMDMAVHAQWHMPSIFQARSNPAGVVISNSVHINGSSLGSSCAKAGFSNLNLSSLLFCAPISLSDHLSYRCFELPARWCSLCFGSCLCLLAYRSTPRHPSPGSSSTRGRQPLGWLPRVYKPACVVTTHRGARARSRHARFLFYWLLFLFLIWGTRSCFMKFALHAGCRWKVRASAFTSFLTFDITMS